MADDGVQGQDDGEPMLSIPKDEHWLELLPYVRPKTDAASSANGRMAGEGVQEQSEDGCRLPTTTIPADEDWWEVKYINSYAKTMAYLSMGVRGLAYLVITWTTVVLLGGFVSVLGKKDFWGLTVIILAQTAGVFDVFLREKLSEIWGFYLGLFNSGLLRLFEDLEKDAGAAKFKLRLVVTFLRAVVLTLVVSIVMCPLAAAYMFGLFISTGISLWRLIEQDFGGDPDDGGANLKPALQLLYSLALVQGVLFSYRAYFARTKKRLVKMIATVCSFNGDDEEQLISGYTQDTITGCEKDPTFARGRNLITYAVDLIKSEEAPANEVTSGLIILARVLAMPGDDDRVTRHMLIKQLIGSTSSSRTLHKLVQMLDPRSPYGWSVREDAATIVEHLADDMQLEQHPRGIQCIASLLYKEALAQQGLRILGKLASDKENCRVMSNTQGLVSDITAPLSCGEFHRDNHIH